MRLHHVQTSMPRGQEEHTRRFYRDALGMTEVEKPRQRESRRRASMCRGLNATHSMASSDSTPAMVLAIDSRS